MEHCKDRLCLQINSTNLNCLSIDATIVSATNSIVENALQSIVEYGLTSESTNQKKGNPYIPSNTILFCIIIGIFIIVVSRIFR